MTDLTRLLLLVGLAGAIVVIFALWRRVHVQERSRERLAEPKRPAATAETRPPARPILREHGWLPWLGALVVGGALVFMGGLPLAFNITLVVIVLLLGRLLESWRAARLRLRLEEQLAEALDLMVAALRAGAGAVSALESAAREARRPLRAQLDELLGRIRYGDDPPTVLQELQTRVPLESFRLFTAALTVHWQTGGSLTPTLATVGRVIRDRIEVNRRIRSLTSQVRTSIVSILGITYFLALLIWRNDPERMRMFLGTTAGQNFVAGALALQVLGIVWATSMSRLKY